jgi:putative transcriptional regulator
VKEQPIRYRPGIDPKRESRTDWDRVDRMTDDEIEAAALSDPDAQPLTDEQLAECFRPGMLRVARERLGLSQKQFAQRFHIQLRALRNWEEGRNVSSEPSGAYLQMVKAVLAALED